MRNAAPALVLIAFSLTLAACGGGRGQPPERPPMAPERMAEIQKRVIARWDYNEDGVASCDDITLARTRLFRLLDTDKDGALSSSEYRYAQFEDKSFMFHDFLRLDTDASGTVGLEELVAVPHSQFLSTDKDHDCIISAEEAVMSMRDGIREGGPGGAPDGDDHRGGHRGPPPGGGRPGSGGSGSPF